MQVRVPEQTRAGSFPRQIGTGSSLSRAVTSKVRPGVCHLTLTRAVVCIETMNALDELRTPSPEPISNAATDTCRSRNDESDRLRSAGKPGTEPSPCTQAPAVRQEEGLIALRYTEGGGDARLQLLDLVSLMQRDVAQLLPRNGSHSHVHRQPVLFNASVLIQMSKREARKLRITVHHCRAAGEEEGGRAARAIV